MAGIYIHIPFCKQKCHYCNFFSVVSLKNKALFLEVLIKEIRTQKSYLNQEEINSVYFGGGTPSILKAEEIQRILDELNQYFSINKNAEITIEANPDDLDSTKINELRKTPVNRFSIGIQSFHDEDLNYLNRVHNSQQSLHSIKNVRNAGFNNLTIDLIYGIPTLNDHKWEENLNIFLKLNIPHLSAYSLTVEPKTALGQFIKKGKIIPVKEKQSVGHYKILTSLMKKNNYEHYEISNFSLPGFYSKNNSINWIGKKYLGLGPSAHSFNGVSRRWNVSSLGKYLAFADQKLMNYEEEVLSEIQRFNEYIMTSLRTSWGCDLEHIETVFGIKYLKYIIESSLSFIAQKQIRRAENKLFLTDKGKLFADGIASDLFIEE